MAANKKRLLKRAQELRGWLLLDQSKPLLYRKEVIYEGEFSKLNFSGNGIEFAIAHDTLNHWKRSLEEQLAAGIQVPFSKSHKTWDAPEDRLGKVVAAEVRENDNGLPSLILDFLFDDEKSRDIGLKGDVSIGSPPVWYDGKGRKWEYPLQHVASTNAPVIPGLETWQAIAAAFNTRGSKMELDELIELLGIEVPDDANTDEAKKALIQAKLKELTGGGAPAEETPADAPVEASQGAKAAPATPTVPQAKKVTVAFSHPTIVNTVRNARLAQLDALVTQNVITPAVKKKLELAHCSAEGIKLELSHADGNESKVFDDAIDLAKAMASDRPLKSSGRSAAGDDPDALELSHDAKGFSFEKFCEPAGAK